MHPYACTCTPTHCYVPSSLQSCLNDLGALSTRFNEVLEFGMSQFNSGALKPRLRPWLDTFLSVDHNITEVSLRTPSCLSTTTLQR